MKIQKMLAGFVAAAMAVATMAVSAFAETVEIDSEYPGSWTSTGRGITKEQLQAVGGDVKIVLTVETRNLANMADQFLINPIDYDNGWISQTVEYCTSDTVTAKTDGWICVRESDTSIEFVYSQKGIENLGDSGLCFSVQNVIVKSADYSLANGPEAGINFVDDKAGKAYCFSSPEEATEEEDAAVEETADEAVEETAEEVEEDTAVEETSDDAAVEETAEETEAAVEETEAAVEETEAAPAETEAPVADATTAPAATGNTAAAAIAVVMVAAGAAALVSKRK